MEGSYRLLGSQLMTISFFPVNNVRFGDSVASWQRHHGKFNLVTILPA